MSDRAPRFWPLIPAPADLEEWAANVLGWGPEWQPPPTPSGVPAPIAGDPRASARVAQLSAPRGSIELEALPRPRPHAEWESVLLDIAQRHAVRVGLLVLPDTLRVVFHEGDRSFTVAIEGQPVIYLGTYTTAYRLALVAIHELAHATEQLSAELPLSPYESETRAERFVSHAMGWSV